MNLTYLRVCLRAMLWLLWTPALAVSIFLGLSPSIAVAGAVIVITIDGGTSIPLSLIIINTFLASLSGGTALVLRIDKELGREPGKRLVRPWLFCAAHMLGSWLAGALAFLMCQGTAWDVWYRLGFVIIASFLGAKFIELVAEKFTGSKALQEKIT